MIVVCAAAFMLHAARFVHAENAAAEAAPAARNPKPSAVALTSNSTLAEWRAATPRARSRIAVTIAHNHLAPTATKLEIATAAMEITGCVTTTAANPSFASWKVATTATTCLTAPEKPKE